MNTQNMTILAETKQFITDLKQSSFLKNVCEYPEHIVMAYVAGSRLLGTATEHSDIDIIIIADDPKYTYSHCGQSLKYKYSDTKTISAHWFSKSIEEFFATPGKWLDQSGLEIMGMVQFLNLTEDFIIYRNEAYDYIFQNFLRYKHRIATFGAYKFITKNYSIVENILNGVDRYFNAHPRHVARLCYLADFLEGLPNQYYELIKEIKYHPDKNKHLEFVKERLSFLVEYLANNPMSLELEEKELIRLMYTKN